MAGGGSAVTQEGQQMGRCGSRPPGPGVTVVAARPGGGRDRGGCLALGGRDRGGRLARGGRDPDLGRQVAATP